MGNKNSSVSLQIAIVVMLIGGCLAAYQGYNWYEWQNEISATKVSMSREISSTRDNVFGGFLSGMAKNLYSNDINRLKKRQEKELPLFFIGVFVFVAGLVMYNKAKDSD